MRNTTKPALDISIAHRPDQTETRARSAPVDAGRLARTASTPSANRDQSRTTATLIFVTIR